jgi:hypothetical protein
VDEPLSACLIVPTASRDVHMARASWRIVLACAVSVFCVKMVALAGTLVALFYCYYYMWCSVAGETHCLTHNGCGAAVASETGQPRRGPVLGTLRKWCRRLHCFKHQELPHRPNIVVRGAAAGQLGSGVDTCGRGVDLR